MKKNLRKWQSDGHFFICTIIWVVLTFQSGVCLFFNQLYLKLRCDDEPVLLHTEELLSILGPGEGLDESWLKNQGEESGSDVTEEDVLSSDEEAGEDEEKAIDGKRKGKGETEEEEKMEH